MVAHERDLLVGADARGGADREINRAEAIRSAIDEIAEKDDRPLVAKPRLARGLVEERAEEIGPPVNVADGENLHVRAYAAAATQILDAR